MSEGGMKEKLICKDDLPKYMECTIYYVDLLIEACLIKPIDNNNKHVFRIKDIDNRLNEEAVRDNKTIKMSSMFIRISNADKECK